MDNPEVAGLLNEFKRLKVDHRLQRQALEQLAFHVDHPGGAGLTLFTGPTGVGKTTLIDLFARDYLKAHEQQLRSDPSYVPLLSTCAAAPLGHAFSWKLFFKEAQVALGDPFAQGRMGRPTPPGTIVLPGETGAAAYSRAQLEGAIQQRRTQTWIVDEAQHAIYGSTRFHASVQCDIFKSMGQRTGINLVLCGPYQLLELLYEANGQLCRRSTSIEMRRYLYTNKDDKADLANAMHTILERLPSKPRYPGVRENFDHFYVGCLGCVGIFKDWTFKAYKWSLQKRAAALTIEDFNAVRLAPSALERINAEILLGEKLQQPEGSELPKDLVNSILDPRRAVSIERPAQVGRRHFTKRSSKPGERNPTRDAVGAQTGPGETV